MRLFLVMTAFIVAVPALGQQPNPETLFRSMEKQLREAQGLRIGFEIDFEFGKDGGKIRGDMFVAPENKARINTSGNMGGKDVSANMVSDGKQSLYVESTAIKTPEPKPVEPRLSQALVHLLARGGIFAALDKSPKDDLDLDKSMPIEGFKFIAKEKVGSRETQVVECNIKLPDGKALQMTTWLDTQTNFPLKRRLVAEAPDKKSTITITEVYTEVTLNPKLDPKLFELPK